MKRSDGRKEDETRPMEAKAGIIKRADGSAMFKIGGTVAYAAVYGPRNLYPKFLQNPREGIVRVNYGMMPFSSAGERVRPGPSRRAKEISMVLEKALLPVLNLEDFPNAVVDVYILLPETDAGTRCAGLCAASIALADAGIPMKDMVAAISAGKYDESIILDLNYGEDSYENGCDIPVAMIQGTGEVSLFQMDGEISKEQILKAVELAKKGIDRIFKVQKEALKKKYQGYGEEESSGEII